MGPVRVPRYLARPPLLLNPETACPPSVRWRRLAHQGWLNPEASAPFPSLAASYPDRYGQSPVARRFQNAIFEYRNCVALSATPLSRDIATTGFVRPQADGSSPFEYQ